MKVSLRHGLPCSPDQFWEAFFDPDLTERMYLEAVGATAVSILEQSGDLESELHRRVEWTQEIDAPGPIRKMLGDTTTTVEDGIFRDGVWVFTIDPNAPGGVKISMAGTTRVEPTNDGCVRIFDLEVKVKILGLGKVFEKFAESQAKTGQDDTAEFLRAHFA